MKKITAKIWRRFEKVVALTIKSILESANIEDIQEKLTEPTKDGGYDGSFMIPCIADKNRSLNKAYYKILFEAKLRKNVDKDLPLQDFSKAIIIAINMDSDALIVATNLRLSEGTRAHLRDFSSKTGLKTYYLSPYYIDTWMEKHLNASKQAEDKEIRNLLRNTSVFSSLTPPLELLKRENMTSEASLPPLTGRKRNRLLEEVLTASKDSGGIIIINGDAGAGKTLFCNHLISALEKERQCVYVIDLKDFQTPRVLFIKLLEALWHIPFDTLLSLDQAGLKSVLQNIDADVVSAELKEAILSAFSRDLKQYSQSADILNYYMIKYLLFVHTIRSKHVKIILFFSNVNSLSSQMIDFLLQFLNDYTKQGRVILELRTSEYIDGNMKPDKWIHYLKLFRSMETILCQKTINIFNDAEAYEYIRATLKVSDLDSVLIDSILNVTGYNPLYIGSLIEYINTSHRTKALPRDVLLQKLEHLIVDDKRQIISMLIDAFCKRDSFYAYFFEVIRIFQIPVEENYIGNLLSDYQTDYIDQLVNANLICRVGSKLEVVHPLQFECMLKAHPLMDLAQRDLARLILDTLNQVVLSTETNAMIRIRCHDILNEYQELANIAYPLAVGLRENGQYTLCCQYTKAALKSIKRLDPTYQTLLHLNILLLMVEICIYQEEDSVAEIDVCMQRLQTAVKDFEPSEKEMQSFYLFMAEYYMTKNRYEHYCGKFHQAFDTLQEALKYVESKKEELGDQVIGNIQVEYAIALKEKEDLNQSLAYLVSCLKSQPENPELLFTFHTQEYERLLLSNPKEALRHTEENRAICQCLSRATAMHNEVHWINAQYYMKNYDICFLKATSLFKEAEQIGLKNEAGRLANIIGNLYFLRKDFVNSKMFYEYGINLFQGKGYISNIWALSVNLSSLLTEIKDEAAVKYIHLSIHILSQSYGERIRKPYPLPGYYEKLQVAVVILFYNIKKLECITTPDVCKDLLNSLTEKLLSDKMKSWLLPLSCPEIVTALQNTNHYHLPYLLLGN